MKKLTICIENKILRVEATENLIYIGIERGNDQYYIRLNADQIKQLCEFLIKCGQTGI